MFGIHVEAELEELVFYVVELVLERCDLPVVLGDVLTEGRHLGARLRDLPNWLPSGDQATLDTPLVCPSRVRSSVI